MPRSLPTSRRPAAMRRRSRSVRIRYAGKKSGLLNELTAVLRELPNEEKRDYGRGPQRAQEGDRGEARRGQEERRNGDQGNAGKTPSRVIARRYGRRSEPVDVTLPGTPVASRRPAPGPHRPATHRGDLPPHGLRRRGGTRDRGRLAQLRGPQHPARPPGARRPGHLLSAAVATSCAPTPRRCRRGSWRAANRRSGSSCPGASTGATRTSVTRRCSTRSKDWWSTRASPSVTSRRPSRPFSTPSSPTMSRSGCVPATSRSPSRRPRSTSRASSATRRAAACARARVGSRSSVPGMVDPRVFEAVGVDSERYTGFAFGLGLDRIAMLVYGIPDLRQLFAGDQRLTRQFA